MPKFIATLTHTQYSRATVEITARNLAAAESKASEITSDQIDNWNPFDGDIEVSEVSPIKPRTKSKPKTN